MVRCSEWIAFLWWTLACAVPSLAFQSPCRSSVFESAVQRSNSRRLCNFIPNKTSCLQLSGNQRPGKSRTEHFKVVASLEVIEPSYNLAVGAAMFGTLFGVFDLRKPRLSMYSLPGLMLGLMLLYQTASLRFVFDDMSFGLVRTGALLAATEPNGELPNTKRWSYDHLANYDFFPSYKFPLLVYVKETQTPEHLWNEGPGRTANSPEALSRGAKPGQVHLFPAVANVEQMQAVFDQHRCQKLRHLSD